MTRQVAKGERVSFGGPEAPMPGHVIATEADGWEPGWCEVRWDGGMGRSLIQVADLDNPTIETGR